MSDFSASEVRPGAILAGRYRVEGQIGAGGMGIVVSAEHLQLGSRVAIKYLPPSWLGDPDAVERFKREAWAAAQIKSPHVVRVSDVANLPSGAPFIVMEYLEGEDLAHVLARREPLPIPDVTELILQVCEAIAEAHAIGIVHRDLKPSNIFVTRNLEGHRVAKVLDFGISKLMRDGFGQLGLTTTRTSLGSPTYMSPEQMHSAKEVDGRTDIWALGVILYEMLAGRAPFSAPSLPELALQIATEPVLPLRAAGLDVPVGLERIVQRCLEKDRSKRFPDVAALASALTEFAPITASLHAARAERVLRDSGTSSQSVPAVTMKGVGGEPGSRPRLREAGDRETPRRSGSDRPGGLRSSDKVPRSSAPREDETRDARGSGRAASARGSERPRSSRSSDKVPRAKSRERDDPSGKVVTRMARGSGRPSSGRPDEPAPKPATPPDVARVRSSIRKRDRPGLLLTAAVAVAVLLLAAVAITALVTSDSDVASRPPAATGRSAASETNMLRPAPPKEPKNSGQ
ncbi:MAG TPA: protein kinase [Polyangiales bacterium]|nr:protein kinase [Polyangiales bacterium]